MENITMSTSDILLLATYSTALVLWTAYRLKQKEHQKESIMKFKLNYLPVNRNPELMEALAKGEFPLVTFPNSLETAGVKFQCIGFQLDVDSHQYEYKASLNGATFWTDQKPELVPDIDSSYRFMELGDMIDTLVSLGYEADEDGDMVKFDGLATTVIPKGIQTACAGEFYDTRSAHHEELARIEGGALLLQMQGRVNHED